MDFFRSKQPKLVLRLLQNLLNRTFIGKNNTKLNGPCKIYGDDKGVWKVSDLSSRVYKLDVLEDALMSQSVSA